MEWRGTEWTGKGGNEVLNCEGEMLNGEGEMLNEEGEMVKEGERNG